jgi:hypothetical protein
MGRLIVLGLLLFILWLALRNFMQRLSLSGGVSRRTMRPQATSRISADVLDRCATCGTHVPRSRALRGADGETYCSEPCREHLTPDPSPRGRGETDPTL